MSKLRWSDALSLDLPLMDATHREFVDLLAAVADAPDSDLVAACGRLVDHTDAHFAQEDRWMAQTRFASGNCHATQHDVVLKVLREGLAAGAAGQLEVIRHLARELAAWFPQHTQTMDTTLALHLRNVGFDPLTGVVAHHERLPAETITGCNGSCG